MKKCPKCNSDKIKKTGHFLREIKNREWQKQSEQTINYSCLDCGNVKSAKISEGK